MPVEAIDHVALWVGNARQAAYFYEQALGFKQVAYAGPETGVRHSASYVMRQGLVTFVISSGLAPDSPVADFAHRHGDGVKTVALRVPDAKGPSRPRSSAAPRPPRRRAPTRTPVARRPSPASTCTATWS